MVPIRSDPIAQLEIRNAITNLKYDASVAISHGKRIIELAANCIN
jgi:hypothetical protein